MINDQILILKSSKSGAMSDVTISALEAEIKREYEQDDAKDLIRKFHDMMLGSTVGNINDETAIYPQDIAAIFGLLKIPIKFINDKGNELAINGDSSGVLTWYRHSSDLSWQGAAAGILKNIQTNKQFRDDESLQSAVDEPED
jgi:hypothetical protein